MIIQFHQQPGHHLALAALGAGKRLPGVQGELLDRGKKLLSSTSASSTLSGEVRSHLVQAGKSAAVAAVGNRIDFISESLHERSETMRGGSADGSDEDETPEGDYEDEPEEESSEGPEDLADEPEDEVGYADEDVEQPEDEQDEAAEPGDGYEDEPADEEEYAESRPRLATRTTKAQPMRHPVGGVEG